MNLAFVSGQNFAANSFSCFIITSFQLKEKYLSFEALGQTQDNVSDNASFGIIQSVWSNSVTVRALGMSQKVSQRKTIFKEH